MMDKEVEDLLKRTDDSKNPKLKAIKREHKGHMKGYEGSTYVGDDMTYQQFEAAVGEFVKYKHGKSYNGGTLEDDLALEHARKRYREATGQDLREAFIQAKEEGSMRDTLESVSEAYSNEAVGAKVTSIFHKEVGEDHAKRKKVVTQMAEQDGLSSDVSRDMLAGRYDAYHRERTRLQKQGRQLGAGVAYRN